MTEIVGSVADLMSEVEPGWIRAGPCIARRAGPGVQVIDIDISRWDDQFVPRFGLTYLRSGMRFLGSQRC